MGLPDIVTMSNISAITKKMLFTVWYVEQLVGLPFAQ